MTALMVILTTWLIGFLFYLGFNSLLVKEKKELTWPSVFLAGLFAWPFILGVGFAILLSSVSELGGEK